MKRTTTNSLILAVVAVVFLAVPPGGRRAAGVDLDDGCFTDRAGRGTGQRFSAEERLPRKKGAAGRDAQCRARAGLFNGRIGEKLDAEALRTAQGQHGLYLPRAQRR